MLRGVHKVVELAHFDPRHSEGHWLYGGLGEHQSHGYLHIAHIALSLGQKGQALQTRDRFSSTGSDQLHNEMKKTNKWRERGASPAPCEAQEN